MHFPPRSWAELEDWLQPLSEPRGPGFFERAGVRRETHRDEIHLRILRADVQHALAVRQAISELVATGSVNAATPPDVQALLRLRLECLYCWASDLQTGLGPDRRSLIPFPENSRALLEWLLTEWWRDNGPDLGADLLWMTAQLT